MRVSGLFIGFFIVLALLFQFVLPTDAQESTGLWSQNVEITDNGAIPASEASQDPLCSQKSVSTRQTSGPLEVLDNGRRLHDEKNEEQSSSFSACVTQTAQGIFADNKYFSSGGNTKKLMRLNQTHYGVNYLAAPYSNAVVVTSYNGLRRANEFYIQHNLLLGDLLYNPVPFDLYDIEWAPKDSAGITYTNGQRVLHYGQSYSRNGKFAVIRIDGNTFARLNMQTQELTPFYRELSIRNVPEMSISGDGKYAVTFIDGDLLIHDLESCNQSFAKDLWEAPTTTAIPDGCESSDFTQRLYAATGGYDGGYYGSLVDSIAFSANNSEITLSAGKSPSDWKKVSLRATDYSPSVQGYLALGDSFSSGEGDLDASWYEPGTDEQGNKDTFEGRNLCHLSRRSYPYLIAQTLGYLPGNGSEPVTPLDNSLFHSVACSGAVIHNVVGGSEDLRLIPGAEEDFRETENQYRNDFLADLDRWQPGRVKQLDVLDFDTFGGYSSVENKPEAITLAIGGNDAGFGEVIKSCALSPLTCSRAVPNSPELADLLISITLLKDVLKQTYLSAKNESPETNIYVHGYPHFVDIGDSSDIETILNGHSCALNTALDRNERQLVIAGVEQMNRTIQAAAQEAGVFYVDVENILNGVNLCSGAADEMMHFNGVTGGNDIGPLSIGGKTICVFDKTCLGKESFHPNPKAHLLYSQALLDQTNNFTAPMPEPTTATLPLPEINYSSDASQFLSRINIGEAVTRLLPSPKEVIIGDSVEDLKGLVNGLLPGSKVQPFIYSTPTQLGEFVADENGVFDQQIIVPTDIEPGVHEIHLFVTLNTGEQADLYQMIFIAHDDNDFDGDGVIDENDSCQTIANSFIDEDFDGIDDVCDPQLTIDQQDSLLQKGVPSSETVAGDNEFPQVLGVATDSNQAGTQALESTGSKYSIISLYAGILILLTGIVVSIKAIQD